MDLTERLDHVKRVRGIASDMEWCDKAGVSDRYLTVQRQRFKADPTYRLPERGAIRLAAAANVSVAWLREGKGSMDDAAPTTPRLNLVATLGRAIVELAESGDTEGVRLTTEFLTKIVGTVADDDDAEAPPEKSGTRLKPLVDQEPTQPRTPPALPPKVSAKR